MGLDTTHDAWHGPYSSFNSFRIKIAAAVGENLGSFEGFGGTKSFNDLKRGVRWLLDHSDCDGHITPKRCKLIADDLKSLLPILPNDDSPHPFFTTKAQAEKFIKGCLKAYKAKQNLEFH